MRARLAPAVGALLCCVPGLGAEAVSPAPFAWRSEVNTAFAVGESITYDIRYGFLSAGTAELNVRALETVRGRPAYHLRATARTNRGMDPVFKVRDINESWLDWESLCPVRFRQDIREGLYRRRVETVYDPPAGRFLYKKWRHDRESVYDGEAPPFVQDVLSALYYVRTRPLAVGAGFTLDANSGRQTWPLVVHVRGRETVEVPAGRFVCFRLEPEVRGEGLFQAKGKLEVWVTDDARRLPVLLRSRVAVGAFDAAMVDYVPGGGEIPVAIGPPPGGIPVER